MLSRTLLFPSRFHLSSLSFRPRSDCVASYKKQKQAIAPPNLYLNPNSLHHTWVSVHACACARTVCACIYEPMHPKVWRVWVGMGGFRPLYVNLVFVCFCLLATGAPKTWPPHAGTHTSHHVGFVYRSRGYYEFCDHLAVGTCTCPKCTKPHSPK